MLRLRLVLEPEFGPAWLTLLCLCAWLRGGIIGTSTCSTWGVQPRYLP